MSKKYTETEKLLYLKEYELCQNSIQKLESNIWQTGGIIGIGSVASLISIAFKVFDKSNVPATKYLCINMIFGTLIVLLVWIWWGMARRWWDIQHITILRMKHIEEMLNFGQINYIKYKDTMFPDPAIKDYLNSILQGNQIKEIDDKFPYAYKRGVQKWLQYMLVLITSSWVF